MTEYTVARPGNPVLRTEVLNQLANLIGDLYPGVWEVYDHGPANPDDYAIGIGTQEDTGSLRVPERSVLPGPIGHHNLARYIVAVQPAVVRALIADNKRLRAEVSDLRAGKGHFPTE